jgi:hypothetical protein
MNDSKLSRLLAAERAEAPSAAQTAQGWEGLQSALQADLPALAIAHGPLQLGLSLATKSLLGSGLVAFAVTTGGLGVHAALQSPAASTTPAAVVAPATPTATIPVAPALPEVRTLAPELAPVAPPAPARPRSSTESASTFADELRLIKAAKQELDAGRPHLARVWLDQYARLYPSGVFRTERVELERRLSSGSAASGNFPEQGER